jgi:hypothetical protein
MAMDPAPVFLGPDKLVPMPARAGCDAQLWREKLHGASYATNSAPGFQKPLNISRNAAVKRVGTERLSAQVADMSIKASDRQAIYDLIDGLVWMRRCRKRNVLSVE